MSRGAWRARYSIDSLLTGLDSLGVTNWAGSIHAANWAGFVIAGSLHVRQLLLSAPQLTLYINIYYMNLRQIHAPDYKINRVKLPRDPIQ